MSLFRTTRFGEAIPTYRLGEDSGPRYELGSASGLSPRLVSALLQYAPGALAASAKMKQEAEQEAYERQLSAEQEAYERQLSAEQNALTAEQLSYTRERDALRDENDILKFQRDDDYRTEKDLYSRERDISNDEFRNRELEARANAFSGGNDNISDAARRVIEAMPTAAHEDVIEALLRNGLLKDARNYELSSRDIRLPNLKADKNGNSVNRNGEVVKWGGVVISGLRDLINVSDQMLAILAEYVDPNNEAYALKAIGQAFGNAAPIKEFARRWVPSATPEATRLLAKIDSLKAKSFSVTIQKMRGLGALSNAEGRAITNSLGAAIETDGTRSYTPEVFLSLLRQSYKEIAEVKRLAQEDLQQKLAVNAQRAPAEASSFNSTMPSNQAPSLDSFRRSSDSSLVAGPRRSLAEIMGGAR